MRRLDKQILKQFYETYEIEPVDRPDYFSLYEIIEDKAYPKFTTEKFCQLLTVCWHNNLDMNFDRDNAWDTEEMIYRREMSYEQSVLKSFAEDFPIQLHPDTFNTIFYEVNIIFND